MPNTFSDNKKVPVNYLPSQDGEGIDLGELLATLVDSKWLIALITVLVLIIGTTKALIDTPVYKTDAMLQVEKNSPSLGALGPVADLMDSEIPAETEIALIKSRMTLGAAVKNLNLEIIAKPKYFPVIGEAIARRFQQHNDGDEVSRALFGQPGYAWGGELIRVDTFTVPSNLLGEELILIAGKRGRYSLMYEDEVILEGEVGKLASKQVEDKKQPVTLFVSLLKSRPDTQFILMRQFDGEVISELQETLSVVEKGKKTGILDLTMESTSPDSALQTLNEVANIYVRQNVEQKSAEAQKTLEFLEKQLPMLKGQLEAATTALNAYRTRHGSIDLDLETQSVLKGVVEIQTQITLLQQKRDELRQKFTESHSSVVAIDKQISRLQGQMNSNDKKIEVLPETQQVILRLARDVQVNTELYTALLNNTQTLRVSKAGTVGNVRIIDYAVLPTKPIKPQKALIVAVSFILGLILGITWVFIRKSLHRGVEDPALIEKQLNIPVYATIPHSVQQEKINIKFKKNYKRHDNELSILALENKDDLAIESLRSLRATLHFSFLEAQNNIIMITGPSPGIGKSFVSINLAAVLADAGKKILLIDADLRKGSMNKALGVSREQGLSEFIANTITLDVAIHKIPMANFDFIATGSIPPNPSELLLHDRFGILLESISKLYDHVIIDSPPILAVTDAAIIGRMASATLMVIRAGQHPMRELEQSSKRLLQAGVDIKGIVFNDVPESSSRYGFGKYVYQYSYQKSN
jgi:tyrosine-protein kinase Etk/Wzc